MKVFWANQGAGGTHVNISGAGVAQHSRKVAAATRFLEWLSAGKAQEHFAAVNMEFPANPAGGHRSARRVVGPLRAKSG